MADFSDVESRKRAWAALKRCPEFKSFFLDYFIGKELAGLEMVISRDCPPDKLECFRGIRDRLEALHKSASQAVDTAGND